MIPKIRAKQIILVLCLLFILLVSFLAFFNTNENDTNLMTVKERVSRAINNKSYSHESVTYYVSANGISSDGTDVDNPMSLDEANKKTFNGNDKILLKAGDIFYGQIDFKIDTSIEDMAYIGCYGEGEKPILSAAKIIESEEKWEKYEDNIYRVDLKNFEKFSGLKKNDQNSCDIGFWEDEKGNIYGKKKNLLANLNKVGDFYCDGRYFYVRSEINPYKGYGKIILATKLEMVRVGSRCVVENLHIEYTGSHGVVKKYTNIKDTEIRDCIIEKIGGSYLYGIGNKDIARYGNGIEFWNQAENTYVHNCIFSQVFDAAYTLQGNNVTNGFKNNICENNIFINCSYNTEFFTSNSTGLGNPNMEETIVRNNISINQDRGWGYLCRTNETKYLGGNVVISRITDKSKILYYNNISFNSLRLYFKRSFVKDETFKKVFCSYNNINIIGKDTSILGDDDREIVTNTEKIKEYGNLDEQSFFGIITDEQTAHINNDLLIKNLNYEKIRTYYENLALETRTNTILDKIYSYYAEIDSNAYSKEIKNEVNNINAMLKEIKSQKTNINLEELNKLFDESTNIINIIIRKKEDELIKNTEKIFEQYQMLFNGLLTDTNIADEEKIKNEINTIISKYNNNTDLEIEETTDLINRLKELYQNIIDCNNNVEKYLYERETEKTCTTVNEMLDLIISSAASSEAKNISASFSSTEPTNKDVTVTINLPNNSYVKGYQDGKIVYTENAKKQITVVIRGYEFTYEIAVTNIDKEAPTISNITDGVAYLNEASPKVSDTNLSDVKLYYEGQAVNNYYNGAKLTDIGSYIIIATDKAGNESRASFSIYEVISDKYNISGNYIKNITKKTEGTQVANNIHVKSEYELIRNNSRINSSNNVATGDILKVGSSTFTLIVAGDITKTSDVNVKDLVKLRKYLIDTEKLTEIEKLAADVNEDTKINVKDLVGIRKLILK